MEPLSALSIAACRRLMLPVAGAALKVWSDHDHHVPHIFGELAAHVAGGSTHHLFEHLLKKHPQLGSELGNNHLVRFTGSVIGALILRHAGAPMQKKHRPDLQRLAAAAPAGWIQFVEKG